MSRKQVIEVKVLPGEPLDGSGRVCIHLFVPDGRGPFSEPCGLYMADVEVEGTDQTVKQLASKATRGRLACNPKRTVAPVSCGAVTTVTMRTDDPRAVTCPKCKASVDFSKMMDQLTAALAGK